MTAPYDLADIVENIVANTPKSIGAVPEKYFALYRTPEKKAYFKEIPFACYLFLQNFQKKNRALAAKEIVQKTVENFDLDDHLWERYRSAYVL